MTYSENTETYSRAPIESDDADSILEAFREALQHVLAEQTHQWGRERALIEAQAGHAVAELRAEVTRQLAALNDLVRARLDSLRDGEPGPVGPQGERGLVGPSGLTGEKGDKGDPGNPGEKGDTGPAGAPGEIGLKGEPGDPGERGEPGAVGERGAPGEPGPQGERGEPGAPGERGERGDAGAVGRSLVTGEGAPPSDSDALYLDVRSGDIYDAVRRIGNVRGPRGVAGPEGKAGAPGERGEPGEIGPPGAAGERGERGLRGEPGAIGAPGDRGEKGDPGEPGQPGERGEPGAPGAHGVGERGPAGERGEPGQPGERGEIGAAGERGEKGEPGDRGEAGQSGERGERGEKGDPGERGEQGQKGDPGERGPKGVLSIVRVYDDGPVYYAGEVVAHDGGTYQARFDTGRAPPHDDWTCLAAPGSDGRDGLTPTIRGTFDPNASYQKLDIVAFNKGSFIARHDDPGACPGDGWQLITASGVRGDKGARGDKGPKGDPGPTSADVVGWRIERDAYRAIPVLSDGKEGAALDLRALFEQFQQETS